MDYISCTATLSQSGTCTLGALIHKNKVVDLTYQTLHYIICVFFLSSRIVVQFGVLKNIKDYHCTKQSYEKIYLCQHIHLKLLHYW